MAKRLRKEEQIMPDIRILTEGDSSVLVEFGKEISPEINRKITATVQLMKEQHIEGVVDMIPAFCSLLVNYDPRVISYDDLKKRLEILLKMEVTAGEGCRKVYEIPVCYGDVVIQPIFIHVGTFHSDRAGWFCALDVKTIARGT